MDFERDKECIQRSLSLVGEKYDELIIIYEKAAWWLKDNEDILKRVNRSRNLNGFLSEIYAFYDVIKSMCGDPSFRDGQTEKIKSIITHLTIATVYLSSNVYTDKKRLFGLEQFESLVTHPVFTLGAFIVNEEIKRETEDDYSGFIGECAHEAGMNRTELLIIQAFIVELTSQFRDIMYNNMVLSSIWAVKSSLVSKDWYLDILLREYWEGYRGPEFIIAVKALVSPLNHTTPDIEDRVDRVLGKRFGALPDTVKKDIIERCTYRDLGDIPFSPTTEDMIADSRSRRVLEPYIRRHVHRMLQTIWLDEEDGGKEKRTLLKYKCLDCAYISARLKERMFAELGEGHETDGPFGDKALIDNAAVMSKVFNIILRNVHVLVVKLENSEMTIRYYEETPEVPQGNRTGASCKTSFHMDDWDLQELDRLIEERDILSKVIGYSGNPNGSDFRYSLIYLENYRGIDKISVSFDHRYMFLWGKDIVRLKKVDVGSQINHYYGKKIYSMTGLVGKNGAGKSSVIDFLRDSFLSICSDLYNERLDAVNGVVDIEPSLMSRYRLEKAGTGSGNTETDGSRFFVVFHFADKDYFLTNLQLAPKISDLNNEYREESGKDAARLIFEYPSEVHPYQIGDQLPLFGGNRRIVYFSQFLAPDGVTINEDLKYGKSTENPAVGEEGIIDLSEESFNHDRISVGLAALRKLNLSLLMQLMFYYFQHSELKKYFGDDFSASDLEVVSDSLVEFTESSVKSLKLNELKGPALDAVLQDRMAYIRPFSSGQYSKFALLSRLFWCLKGWDEFPEEFEKKSREKMPDFDKPLRWIDVRDRMVGHYLKETDAAVLFFDEADTYYHPDWQRGFIWDIVEMIKNCRTNPVQVVFTTNSPLMLSDLRKQDIYLMKDYRVKAPVGYVDGLENMTDRWNPSVPTFGQNIHTLMAKPFFLERTIGRFADQRIEWLASLLTDVSEIVEFLESEPSEEDTASVFMKHLEDKNKNLYRKVRSVWDAVKAEKTTDTTKDEEIKAVTVEAAESRYVTDQIIEKFFMTSDCSANKDISFDCVEMILLNHINLIGEDVLRNELYEMYSDFISRVESSCDRDAQIDRLEKKLNKLKKERDFALLRRKDAQS